MALAPARAAAPIQPLRMLAGQAGGSLVVWAIVMFFVFLADALLGLAPGTAASAVIRT